MSQTLILAGDVNLMNISDPNVPFRLVAPVFNQADLVFINLECCLYNPPNNYAIHNEGFYAPAGPGGEALKLASIHAVGNANNVNYGDAAIQASNRRLDELEIAHCGAGNNRNEAYRPLIIDRGGVRYGFLQRTSIYWPINHEATDASTGVAVIRGHTAYQLPLHRTRRDIPPCNRPGLPPIILTWADPDYLAQFREDVVALRKQADIVVASCHWGLKTEVLHYMTEIGHAAIDAGADIVMGNHPHMILPVELYKGKPIFYGIGSLSFDTGHFGKKHGDWIGMMIRVAVEEKKVTRVAFSFVRHNDRNETVLRRISEEQQALEDITTISEKFGSKIIPDAGEATVVLPNGIKG